MQNLKTLDADFYSDMECNGCSISPVCNGGCPYIRIEEKYATDKKNEYCILMKDFENDFILAHIEQLNSKKDEHTKG